MSTLERVEKIFQEAYGYETENFTPELTPDDVPKWDSIGHMNMVSLLEGEFNVQFELDDIMEMATVGKIVELVEARGGK